MTIKKVDGHRLVSSKGRNLGTYSTKAEAKHREKQVQFFKNLKKSSGGSGSLKAKVRNKELIPRKKSSPTHYGSLYGVSRETQRTCQELRTFNKRLKDE